MAKSTDQEEVNEWAFEPGREGGHPPAALATLLPRVIEWILAAGEAVMAHRGGCHTPHFKADASPVTAADQAAEALLTERLLAHFPGIPVVGEEACAAGGMPAQAPRRFWLLDPLDGTKEFLNGSPDFTVNLALIEDGQAVLGIVLAPALAELYWGVPGWGAAQESVGRGATRKLLACRAVPLEGLTVMSSRSHGDAAALDRLLAGQCVARAELAGSSLKFCRVAQGQADLYPRLGRTMEWDTAAAQAVLEAAGGRVTQLDGSPLRYGKPGFENPHFVARGLALKDAPA